MKSSNSREIFEKAKNDYWIPKGIQATLKEWEPSKEEIKLCDKVNFILRKSKESPLFIGLGIVIGINSSLSAEDDIGPNITTYQYVIKYTKVTYDPSSSKTDFINPHPASVIIDANHVFKYKRELIEYISIILDELDSFPEDILYQI